MGLNKRQYTDGQTIITAANLNEIQDCIIAIEGAYVPKTRTVAGKALSSNITLAASDVGAVPTSRTVNSKALSSNITLSAADVGAVPVSRTVNSKALSSNITLSAADVSAVPTSRKVNSKALSADITLTAADVSAVPTTRKVNNKALSSDITLAATDIGYGSSNVGTELGSLSNATNEKNILLLSDSYGVHSAAGGRSWEGTVYDNLSPQGYSITQTAKGGGGFGYASDSEYYFANYINTLTANNSINLVFILCGANDGNLLYGSSATEASIKDGMLAAKTALKQKFPNAKIHLGFVGRYRLSNHFAAYKQARDIYRSYASEIGIAFANNFEYILHNRSLIQDDDNVHPTLAGSQLIGYYATQYILHKNISVEYEDTYTIACGNTWFNWNGKSIRVRVRNETTFVNLLSEQLTYEYSLIAQQAIPVGTVLYFNEDLTTSQFLIDTSQVTDGTVASNPQVLDAAAENPKYCSPPVRYAFVPDKLFMAIQKPYGYNFANGSVLRFINGWFAFDSMMT